MGVCRCVCMCVCVCVCVCVPVCVSSRTNLAVENQASIRPGGLGYGGERTLRNSHVLETRRWRGSLLFPWMTAIWFLLYNSLKALDVFKDFGNAFQQRDMISMRVHPHSSILASFQNWTHKLDGNKEIC